MDTDEEKCKIGANNSKACDMKGCSTFENFTVEQQELLQWRTGLNDFEPSCKVCAAHTEEFLRKYSFFYHKTCFDSFSKHKKKIKERIREIDLVEAKEIRNHLDLDIIPGMKVCHNCTSDISERIQKIKEDRSSATNEGSDSQSTDSSQNTASDPDSQICKDTIEDIFAQLHLSKITLKGTKESSKNQYLKRKLDEATETIGKKMKTAYHLGNELESGRQELQRKAQKYDDMMNNVKTALPTCSYASKIQLLTLVPNIETKEVQTALGITRSTAEAARKLKANKGLYAVPNKKLGSNVISDDVKQTVINFYCDETSGNSRVLPGKKDCKSVGYKKHKQKQLLLLNLRELYAAYCEAHPDKPVGFSTFCLLRPQWCALAGSPGTHSICVCTTHQNVELLLFAVHSKLTVDELVAKFVCNIENRECMLRKCSDCPDKQGMIAIFDDILFHQGEEEEEEEEVEEEVIRFKEWISTDRTELRTHELCKTDFLEHFACAVDKLIPHWYDTIKQFAYIRKLKGSLASNECLVMLDFSENYSFIVQDSAQGYYWSKDACTIHPSIIYYKEGIELEHISICFISDDLDHDTNIVHLFQDRIINNYIKKLLPHIQKIYYISDGCAAQYKNCHNFLHLCQHYEKYNIEASWTFFTTSHGKSPCDGIGATVKREAANESIRRPYDNQIMDIDALLDCCKTHAPNISCEIVRKKEVENARKAKEWLANTVPGTRSFHQFDPLSNEIIQ